MAIGLYRDLAVGAHPSGAEVWCHSDALLPNVHIGAPPDIWNPAGQDWGLPPFHPKRLEHVAYQPFIDLLQSNMRYCGALRIDHAMALERLYWIPKDHQPSEGAYVQYPLDDLVGIVALESHRNECLVIGEDLGTVPPGFRQRMEEANILSYRVLFFERNDDAFVEPGKYPPMSLSVASSHDLPTLQGWWHERDLDQKDSLQLFPTANLLDDARVQRSRDRRDMLARFESEGFLDSKNADPPRFVDAAHAFLARTASMLTLIQIDDLSGELDPVNVPATTSEVPNWRRKQSVTLEEFACCAPFAAVARAMEKERHEAGT
jgi:4-alpha-glucanotransferase